MTVGESNAQYVTADGRRVITHPDGRTRTEYPNSNRYADTYPDGRIVSATYGGDTVTVFPDGSVEMFYDSLGGRTIKTAPDGRRVITHADGSFDFGGLGENVAKMHDDGQTFTRWTTGRIVTTFPNGTTFTEFPDGRRVTTFPDGSTTEVTR